MVTTDRRERRSERLVAGCFLVAALAGVGLGLVYWQGGQPQLEGLLLALSTGGIGAGIVFAAEAFLPTQEVSEERGDLGAAAETDGVAATLQAGQEPLARRRLILGSAAAALAAFAGALLFPIRSLGPRPGRGLKRTPYAEGGLRLVRENGAPVRAADLPVDAVVTVWPEGHREADDAATLLIRTRPSQDVDPRPGRRGWTVDGIVAYSLLCTHTGCPVGLYQAEIAQLLCPCHQSTFDVLDGARPVFGPATRSLPQLPLGVDAQGYLIATGDFSGPVGPGFWDRGR